MHPKFCLFSVFKVTFNNVVNLSPKKVDCVNYAVDCCCFIQRVWADICRLRKLQCFVSNLFCLLV